MSVSIKLFFLAGMFTVILSADLFSQTSSNTSNGADSLKTVAIYSSRKNFFKYYPLDTLISHLNLLNTNKRITYYKNTADRSRTGFYADYLIDLDLSMTLPVPVPGKMVTETRPNQPVMELYQFEGRTYSRRVPAIVNSQQNYISGYIKAGQGTIRIKIIEKYKNEKVSRKTLQASHTEVQELEALLILPLVNFLLSLK